MYPNSFDKKSKVMLNTLARNESDINYKNLSYKILLLYGKFYELNFFRKYGDLYTLLENLVTKKMIVSRANSDQKPFILDLMFGYNEGNFDNKILTDVEEGRSHSASLEIANDVFLDTKKNP